MHSDTQEGDAGMKQNATTEAARRQNKIISKMRGIKLTEFMVLFLSVCQDPWVSYWGCCIFEGETKYLGLKTKKFAALP